MKRALSTLAILVVLAIAIVAAWIAYALFGDRSHPATTTGVVVARGSAFADIAAQLQSAGVIGSAELFRIYAKASRADTQARAGEFRFRRTKHRPKFSGSCKPVARRLRNG